MKIPVLAAVLSCAAALSSAQTVEITPWAGYRVGGSFDLLAANSDETVGGLEVKDAGAFGFSVAVQVADDGELEALFARQSTRLQADGFFTSQPLFDLAIETYQLGGNYLFRDDGVKVRPYIGMGLGISRLVPDGPNRESETRFAASFAGGMKAYLGKHFGLRLEVRGFFTVLDSSSDVFCDSFSGCFVRTSGSELSQAEFRGGLIFRF